VAIPLTSEKEVRQIQDEKSKVRWQRGELYAREK
jgi:hypothetical protein